MGRVLVWCTREIYGVVWCVWVVHVWLLCQWVFNVDPVFLSFFLSFPFFAAPINPLPTACLYRALLVTATLPLPRPQNDKQNTKQEEKTPPSSPVETVVTQSFFSFHSRLRLHSYSFRSPEEPPSTCVFFFCGTSWSPCSLFFFLSTFGLRSRPFGRCYTLARCQRNDIIR